jgi:methylglutaconyl-CoA hydratase
MSEMSSVNVHRRGAVTVLELARPATGNALAAELVADLSSALASAQGAGVRALVLTGGGKHFCTGADLRELAANAEAPAEQQGADAARLAALYTALLRCPLLTVAAVRGAAYGGGAGLAAACDVVIAGLDSSFQFSELRLGFVPALITTFLPRRVAAATLARLYFDPQPLDAERAIAVGLADEVAPEPLEAAVGRSLAICRKVAPSAIAETKRLLLAAALPRLDQQLAEAVHANARQRAHPECRRGVAEFLEKKAFPDWIEEG